jgi:hypothetical protein
MVPSRAGTHDVGVPRVLIWWSRPHHLSIEDAERWVRTELRGVIAADAVRSAELVRLEPASQRHGGEWHWLLELELDDPVRDRLESGAWGEWLADLRLLGMKPEVAVATGPVEMGEG